MTTLDLITIKGIKYFRGSEGYGYNATLCIDGQKAALAINHGDGGPTLFEYFGPEAKEKFEAAARKWAAARGKEAALEPEGLYIEAKLDELEGQKRKEANARRGLPITVLCYAGVKHAEDAWEKEFYLGAKDEASLKEALAKNSVVEWRRV